MSSPALQTHLDPAAKVLNDLPTFLKPSHIPPLGSLLLLPSGKG